jgi:hypothetical protein
MLGTKPWKNKFDKFGGQYVYYCKNKTYTFWLGTCTRILNTPLYLSVFRIRIRKFLGPPGSGAGSVSRRYGSGFGTGTFHHQAKIVRKTFISNVLWLHYDFLSLKNDVNISSKSNKQKTRKICLGSCLEGHWSGSRAGSVIQRYRSRGIGSGPLIEILNHGVVCVLGYISSPHARLCTSVKNLWKGGLKSQTHSS